MSTFRLRKTSDNAWWHSRNQGIEWVKDFISRAGVSTQLPGFWVEQVHEIYEEKWDFGFDLDASGIVDSRRFRGFTQRAVRDADGIFWLLTNCTDFTDLTQNRVDFDILGSVLRRSSVTIA